MTTTIWHNPRCSKSRQTLALVEEKEPDVTIRMYLENTPDAAEIRKVLSMLGIGARDLMRTKESLYKELGVQNVSDEAELIEIMVANPKLIERPVVIKNGKARIGRPPESVLEIL
ncbi:arsenate reductase (glutaredoxin) [uncultured Cohaesibacter sp.]|uniref:arsenate reductase (glutaredoxin) n=1 Tax=uncultured Cohaesibacter sp. TaxID=1002546 RepID=UPI0029C87DDD|nr:arsenate reductase (glutaredoxin) [uncultured Cohaesibacter sp.]